MTDRSTDQAAWRRYDSHPDGPGLYLVRCDDMDEFPTLALVVDGVGAVYAMTGARRISSGMEWLKVSRESVGLAAEALGEQYA
jgi:hypothetical protein